MNALEKLRETVDAIVARSDPTKIMDQWGLAGRLLSRFPVDQGEVKRVLRERDASGLDALVRSVESPGRAEAPGAAGAEFTEEELTHALKVFRKRLKVSRLADESKLGGRYTSGGRKSGIDAIQPPTELPAGIWKALEKAGRLRHTGGGFYAEP
jgi:hypothetical protein